MITTSRQRGRWRLERVATAIDERLDVALVGSPGRQSVLAEARVGPAAETIVVASHLDTVPVDGMQIDPFDPVIRDDRLYGRGSCDTKSGMAALLEAVARVLERGSLRRNLIVVGEADEEHRSAGAYDILAALAGRRPDWAIATEPTGLRLIHAHKGVVHARVRAHGRACHSSDPSAGRNAIVLLARAILAIEASAAVFLERPHPDLGPATLSIGVVRGGHAPNIVPDDAWLWVDRRTLPCEGHASVQRELEDVLAQAGLEGEVVIDSCREEKPPLGNASDSVPVHAAGQALASLGLPAGVGTVQRLFSPSAWATNPTRLRWF